MSLREELIDKGFQPDNVDSFLATAPPEPSLLEQVDDLVNASPERFVSLRLLLNYARRELQYEKGRKA